jgi:cell division initiation protein
MELAARDIHEKQFHDAWRGYNQEEVDDFLDRVAEAFDFTSRENAALHRRVNELEQALTTSRETEEMLKKTLVSAQQAAEEAIAKAKDKASALLADAEERAARANEETRQKLANVDAEIKRRALEADREHQARRRDMDATIERLRSFESELKRRLSAFLEQQTRALGALTQVEAAERQVTPRPPAPAEANGGESRPGAVSAGARGEAGDEGDDRTVRLPEEAEVAPPRRGVRGLFTRDEG